jgi:hypothetical protein
MAEQGITATKSGSDQDINLPHQSVRRRKLRRTKSLMTKLFANTNDVQYGAQGICCYINNSLLITIPRRTII